ncbi:MAG: Gldg family protein [Candidatus Omnitrophota bacterium]
MNNIWTILKRELGAYFNSAIAYIYLIVFIAINNGLFMTGFFLIGKADMRSFFDTLPMTLFVFIPVLTMRLWAEDKKENTFELLMTFPMKPAELVLGKFFASLIFYAVSLISTMTLPIVLSMAGRPDVGAIMGGYVGALLMGALFLAIGIFISGFTKEQIVAFVLAILGCFIIYLLGSDFLASFFDGWFSGLGSFMKNYLGAASHVLSFNKGVIDIKDIVYFAVMVFVLLFLNGLFFEGRMRPNAKLVFLSAVFVCLTGAIIFNWLVHDLPFGRFDVTENRIYTVSKASKKILTSLKAPVLIKVYITPVEKMPTALKTLQQDITGKLDELKIVSGNKLKYQVAHIEAANLMEQNKEQKPGLPDFPEAGAETSIEKTLQAKGIVPFQVESIDRDELGVKLVYSALTITYKEKGDEILPRLVPGNIPDMEYLLLSRIVKLTQETKPKMALFSPLKTQELSPEMAQLLSKVEQTVKPQYEDEYANVVPLMRNNGYDVSRIALAKDDPIPAGLNMLLVLNPGVLNDRQVYEINKFIHQGGSALIAAAGFDYSFQISPPMGVEISPRNLNLDINKLIEKWGIKLSDKMLMDENSQIINISTGQNVGPFAVSMPVKIPNQIVINDDTMNRNMPYMSRLPSLFYLWGSALDVSDEIIRQSKLKKTIMFTSSDKSWQATSEGGFLKRESLQFPKTGSEGKFTLGVMLEGQFTDAFAQSGPPAWPAKEGEGSAAPGAAPFKELGLLNPRPGKLIIIGCSKMFTDQVLSSGGNLTLFANIIDGLTLGNDLIEIRSKTPVSRDIKRASDAQKIIYRFLAIFLMPLLLIVYSSLRIFLRGKEKQFYLLARGQ